MKIENGTIHWTPLPAAGLDTPSPRCRVRCSPLPAAGLDTPLSRLPG